MRRNGIAIFYLGSLVALAGCGGDSITGPLSHLDGGTAGSTVAESASPTGGGHVDNVGAKVGPPRTLPDLVVSAVTTPPGSAAGQKVSLSDTTTNNGVSPAPATITRWWLSRNTTLESSGDALIGSRSVPGLLPGATSTGGTTVTIPADWPAGKYYFIAQADATQLAGESDEANNRTTSNLVSIGLASGDLMVSAVTTPVISGAGMAASLSDTTTNSGSSAPAGASATRWWISLDNTLDPAVDVSIGSRPVPELAPGQSSTGSSSVVVPAGWPTGSSYFIAQADGGRRVVETNEVNNTRSKLVKIGPDLRVTGLGAPLSAAHGSTISVGSTTKNIGGGDASASSTGLYLSADTVLDGADVYLGAKAVPALAAGIASNGPTSVLIPASVVPGSYYVIGNADNAQAVIETNEANNTLARAITIN